MTPPVLSLDTVEFRYHGADTPALSALSLEVHAGRSLGIVGESGSGKSTILNLLLGLARPTAGKVRLEGEPLTSRAQIRRLRRLVQPVFQDPYASLDPRQRVDRIIAEPLRSLGLERDGSARERAVATALTEVGLEPSMARRYPHEFSGGQRQRIAIARALITNPTVLLADEPVSALDMATRIDIIELLARLREEHALTIVMVSHDLAIVAALCDEVLVLESGRIVESGPSLGVLRDPRAAATRNLVAAIPMLRTRPTPAAETPPTPLGSADD